MQERELPHLALVVREDGAVRRNYTAKFGQRTLGGDWLKPRVTPQGDAWIPATARSPKAWVKDVVCEAFHGPRPTPEHRAQHLDRNPRNNQADNLRWNLPRGKEV